LAVVALKATPSTGYVFSNWTGGVANAGSASTSVTIEGPQTVTADFVKIEPTSTTLKSSANPSTVGESITFAATVTVTGGAKPTGTVTFNEGTKALKTVTLAGDEASFSTTALTVGSHFMSAVYSGDSLAKTSTSVALNQVVKKAATVTTVTSSANPAHFGQTVKLTATIATSGKPTGTITFASGTTILGKETVNSDTTVLSTSALAVGTHLITASYSGDAMRAPSESSALKQIVIKAATTTKLASSKNPSATGQAVTLTATVSAATGTPTGSVTFKRGTATLGTIALSGGVARSKTAALPKGSDVITATYGGAADYGGSAVSLTQMVQ
jgi:hypothetical protein